MEQNKSSVPLMPRESAKFISQYSKNVSINEEGVKKLSHMVSTYAYIFLDIKNIDYNLFLLYW